MLKSVVNVKARNALSRGQVLHGNNPALDLSVFSHTSQSKDKNTRILISSVT